MVWRESTGELERCTDHLRVGGHTETDSSVTKILLWIFEDLKVL